MDMLECRFRRNQVETGSRIEHSDNWDLFYECDFETNAINTTEVLRKA